MKKSSVLSVVVFGVFSSFPAFANWSAQVIYSEVLFGCNGTTPLTTPSAVNVSAGTHGEFRLPDYAVTTFLLGASTTPATCTIEDSGEAAHPSWNAITLPEGTTVFLNLSTDVTTCSADIEQGGFNRNNEYTLNVMRAGQVSQALGWTETVHFASPTACRDLQ